MPHDKFGKLLKVDDTVLIRFKVKSVSPQEDYCNVVLHSIECMEGDPSNFITISAVNTKQIEKYE